MSPRFSGWLDWSEVGSVVVDGDDDEEAETEDRCGSEGEDRPRRAAGAGHGGGSRRAPRGSPRSDSDYASFSACRMRRKSGTYAQTAGFEAWRAIVSSFRKVSAKRGQMSFTGARIGAGRQCFAGAGRTALSTP